MSALDDLLASNERYAASFDKGDLPVPPARKVAVLTCMDARLDPEKFLGLEEGDAHVIRTAGGRASDDAIRSLVISYKLLDTREFLVIHHDDCGMMTHTNEQIREALRRALHAAPGAPPADAPGGGAGGPAPPQTRPAGRQGGQAGRPFDGLRVSGTSRAC